MHKKAAALGLPGAALETEHFPRGECNCTRHCEESLGMHLVGDFPTLSVSLPGVKSGPFRQPAAPKP